MLRRPVLQRLHVFLRGVVRVSVLLGLLLSLLVVQWVTLRGLSWVLHGTQLSVVPPPCVRLVAGVAVLVAGLGAVVAVVVVVVVAVVAVLLSPLLLCLAVGVQVVVLVVVVHVPVVLFL